jgi:hypothetical protein
VGRAVSIDHQIRFHRDGHQEFGFLSARARYLAGPVRPLFSALTRIVDSAIENPNARGAGKLSSRSFGSLNRWQPTGRDKS